MCADSSFTYLSSDSFRNLRPLIHFDFSIKSFADIPLDLLSAGFDAVFT